MFFHSRSRSREFLGMIASDSHSRIVGMDFFHSLPVPELWEWIFFIPFPFPNFGNRFFHSLPIPEFWEWFFFIPFPFPNWGNGFFQFPSRSRTSGMELSIPVPVPELLNVIPAHPCLHCDLRSPSNNQNLWTTKHDWTNPARRWFRGNSTVSRWAFILQNKYGIFGGLHHEQFL